MYYFVQKLHTFIKKKKKKCNETQSVGLVVDSTYMPFIEDYMSELQNSMIYDIIIYI